MTVNWEAQSRCLALSIEENDAMFFPGPGGKPGRAEKFCGSCIVQNYCLEKAIREGLKGFQAGTTEAERKQMAFMLNITPADIADSLPPEPVKRPVYRKIITVPDVHEWLDADIEPDLNFNKAS